MSNTSNKRVLVPIGDDSEEIETTCITDTLTRFGAEVTVASVMQRAQTETETDLVCTMSRGIKIQADTSIETAAKREWDLIALPGGMPGAEHLRDCKTLTAMLNKQKTAKKLYAAVCASPAVALASNDLIDKDAKATCYPAPQFREKITVVSDDKVVVSDNLTTSQGPGTSIQFALALGEQLFGKEKRDEIEKQMLA